MQYLILPTLTAAQARSAQQAIAKGCVPPTLYWWDVVSLTDGTAAVVIADDGDYGPEGLTVDEVAALKTADQLGALLPVGAGATQSALAQPQS